MEDKTNGSMCCYADDGTLTVTDHDPNALTMKLTRKYNTISQFMVNNRLKLNDEKAHLLVMSTGQTQRQVVSARKVRIFTPSEVVSPSSCEKLLGGLIQDNLKWTEHVRDSSESLIRSISMSSPV